MDRLIKFINTGRGTYKWANSVNGQFLYNVEKNHYQLLRYTEDGRQYEIGLSKRNTSNCPIIIKGFIAFLIKNWGKPEELIFKEYQAICREKFIKVEAIKPGSIFRDLNKEFIDFHVKDEMVKFDFTKTIKGFIGESEFGLLSEFYKSYKKFNNHNNPQNYRRSYTNNTEFDAKEWAVIFYYTYYSHKVEGDTNPSLISNFLTNYNLSLGESSFLTNFYEIKRMIEGRNNQVIGYLENVKKFFADNDEILAEINEDIRDIQ
ncbi:hypothetical protein [Lentimicrobium sp. S6]|uniref:hypothetical protein n=1 Tax=Lentimicrobium sp. S6 TaxID=2735872 RepID=UPI001557D30B|nr:hypothetical protein [Lentimicrobium sp. S6]NPD47613.1 hypothetical protein [Lentimicrobium sp. S6]